MINAKLAAINSAVEDETINYLCDNPYPSYGELIKLLSWYWALPHNFKETWVIDWVNMLAMD